MRWQVAATVADELLDAVGLQGANVGDGHGDKANVGVQQTLNLPRSGVVLGQLQFFANGRCPEPRLRTATSLYRQALACSTTNAASVRVWRPVTDCTSVLTAAA
jgi:hypothetical protein